MSDNQAARRTGLREAHAHLAQLGRTMDMLALQRTSSAADLLHRVALRARELRPDEWLLGHGLRMQAWHDPSPPPLPELDLRSGRNPVCLWSFDHHAALVNSAALRAAGIDAHTPDPPMGRIVRDDRGRPTGLLLESAAKLVWNQIPEPTEAQRRGWTRAGAEYLSSLGYTEVHDLLSQPWLGNVLASLHDDGELPLEVRVYVPLDQFDEAVRGEGEWCRPGVRLAGAKVFADGTLNSRTAWMLHSYADPLPGLPCGQAMMTRDDLAAALARTAAAGLELAVHAIGDAAVRAALDAFEAVARSAPRGVRPRLRIEHAEIIDAADVPRFAALGVVCSVQPCHLLADVEALSRGLPDRLDRVLPLRELIDAGCVPGRQLWFGSDAPIVGPDPVDSIRAATLRRRSGSDPPIAPAQAITEAQAWACFDPRQAR